MRILTPRYSYRWCGIDSLTDRPNAHYADTYFETGSDGGLEPAGGKRRLIRGEGLVARISNDYEPQLPVVGDDIPGPAVTNDLGAVRSLRMVDQWAMVVGRGVRLPCSDSKEAEDDVLSVGPMRPLMTAAPLGGARGHDDGVMQADSRQDAWSVDSWTSEDRCGPCCAQLDDFDWMIPAGDLVGGLPIPKEDDGLSDIEPDVCDVPDEFPVPMETAAVESLCFHVVVQTRPQGGCDPVLPLPVCKGQDFLVVDGLDVIVYGRESILEKSDVSCEICVVADQLLRWLCLSWLRCRWPSLLSLRRDHGLAVARTCLAGGRGHRVPR